MGTPLPIPDHVPLNGPYRDGTEEEIKARYQSSLAFYDEKAKMKVKTPYGVEYSPHYQRSVEGTPRAIPLLRKNVGQC